MPWAGRHARQPSSPVGGVLIVAEPDSCAWLRGTMGVTPCTRCATRRPLANLTRVGDELVCPEDLYRQAEHQISHQKPISRDGAHAALSGPIIHYAAGAAGKESR